MKPCFQPMMCIRGLHGIAELTRTKRFPRSRQKERVRALVELFTFPREETAQVVKVDDRIRRARDFSLATRDESAQTRMCLPTQFHLDEKSAFR
jgi:hypothetical protein